MQLAALLRSHSFLRVERPPLLWDVDADDVPLIRLLGEMIAAALARGTPLGEVVLNVANVSVLDDPTDEPSVDPRPGDYVALTVSGGGDWGREVRWVPEPARKPALLVSHDLDAAARSAGVRFAYTRSAPDRGSVTVFFPRLAPRG